MLDIIHAQIVGNLNESFSVSREGDAIVVARRGYAMPVRFAIENGELVGRAGNTGYLFFHLNPGRFDAGFVGRRAADAAALHLC